MLVAEIYALLDEIAPFMTQESWDNSGLQVGSMAARVERVYASLDADSAMVESLEPNSLLITHHPLIFSALKRIDYTLYPSNLLASLLKKNITLIAMHTNYDKAVLNRYFTERVLGLEVEKEADFLVYPRLSCNFDELCTLLKERLGIVSLRAVKAHEHANEIAICTGSGSEFIYEAGVDTFLTGDIKYHAALEAYENYINLIDITHYASELCFADSLKECLQKYEIDVIITNSINPLTIV